MTQTFTVSLTAELTFDQLVTLFGPKGTAAVLPPAVSAPAEPEAKPAKAPKAKKAAPPVIEEPFIEEPADEPADSKPVDLTALKQLAQEAAKATTIEDVERVLKSVGATRLSTVLPERIPTLVADLKTLIANS